MTQAGRVDRNRRLTAEAGLLLAPLLLLAGATGLLLQRGTLTLHIAIGLVLIPPLALKLASAGHRFARYHLRDAAYVAAGVPAPGLRPIAPPLVLAILVLMVSGVAIWLDPQGDAAAIWRAAHRLSFLVFGACLGAHVIVHLLRTPTLNLNQRLPGRAARTVALATSVVLGLALAFAALVADWPS